MFSIQCALSLLVGNMNVCINYDLFIASSLVLKIAYLVIYIGYIVGVYNYIDYYLFIIYYWIR